MRGWLILLAMALLASGAPAQTGVHTPARGTAERREILDALRAEMRRTDPRPIIFVVRRLRAHGSWAWAEVEPRSPDQREHYEPEAALLRRSGGRWRVVERMPSYEEREGSPEQDDCVYFRAARRRFGAPADVLPLDRCR